MKIFVLLIFNKRWKKSWKIIVTKFRKKFLKKSEKIRKKSIILQVLIPPPRQISLLYWTIFCPPSCSSQMLCDGPEAPAQWISKSVTEWPNNQRIEQVLEMLTLLTIFTVDGKFTAGFLGQKLLRHKYLKQILEIF